MILTDGIPEIKTKKERPLGMRELVSKFKECASDPLPTSVQRIVRFAEEESGEPSQEDDWTFVLVEWVGVQEAFRGFKPGASEQTPQIIRTARPK